MKYESSFKSEADGLEISVMALIPDKKPYRAVVQLVHGMSEHKERYIPFMQYLAKLGYVAVSYTHLGNRRENERSDHGSERSEGNRPSPDTIIWF